MKKIIILSVVLAILISMSGVMVTATVDNNSIVQNSVVCCAISNSNLNHNVYKLMNRDECLAPTVETNSQKIVADGFCQINAEPVAESTVYPRYVKLKMGDSFSLKDPSLRSTYDTLTFDNAVLGLSTASAAALGEVSADSSAKFSFVRNHKELSSKNSFSLQIGEGKTLDGITVYLKAIDEVSDNYVVLLYLAKENAPKPSVSNDMVCCKTAAVVPNPIPSYSWSTKEACAVNCRTNPTTGVKECAVGVSKKIVDDNFCASKPNPNDYQEKDSNMIRIGEKASTKNSGNSIKSTSGNSTKSTSGNSTKSTSGNSTKSTSGSTLSSSELVQSVRIVPGSNKPTLYSSSGSKMQTSVNAKNGFSMSVRNSNGSEEVLTFKSSDDLWNKMTDEKNVQVKTRKTLVTDKNGLGIETSNGTKKIKVLPSQASDRAKEVLNETFGDIELKEDNGKVFYEFNKKKKVKFLGFIPVNARYNAQVDAETDELIQTSKPWFDAISSK